MKVTVENITPSMAAKYLTKNHNNRNLRRHKVEQYASMMKRGQWKEVGDPIRFNNKGELIDGQHRLTAAVEVHMTLKSVVVVRNVAEDGFAVIDTGMGRQPADVIGTGTKGASHKAAAIRLLWVYEAGGDPRLSEDLQLVTRIDISEYWEAHGPELDAVYNASQMLYTSFMGGNRSAWQAFLAMANRTNQDWTEQYIEAVKVGANLSSGDPRLALRNWLSNDRKLPNAGYHLGVLIKVWNMWLSGESRKLVVFKGDEAFPKMMDRKKF